MWAKERIEQWECRIWFERTISGAYINVATPSPRAPHDTATMSYGPFHGNIESRIRAAMDYHRELAGWQMKENNSLPLPNVPDLLLSEDIQRGRNWGLLSISRQESMWLEYDNIIDYSPAVWPAVVIDEAAQMTAETERRVLQGRARGGGPYLYGRSLIEDMSEALARHDLLLPGREDFTTADHNNPWAVTPEDDDD